MILGEQTTVAERLMFSTVLISGEDAEGAQIVGTSFFFTCYFPQGGHLRMLVTNKHVVKGVVKGAITLHETEDDGDKKKHKGNSFTVEMSDFEKCWVGHPDPDIDLCALPMKLLMDATEAAGKTFITSTLDNKWILLSDEDLRSLDAIEEIVMVGYPDGLRDAVNNLPVIRKGSTASHPAVDYNGSPKIMLDIGCFPGSSGSPVAIINRSNNKGGVSRQYVLLGVLSSGPVMTIDGDIVTKSIPTKKVKRAEIEVMMHLGYAIKAKELLTLAEELQKKP